jgi:hypothetical protein
MNPNWPDREQVEMDCMDMGMEGYHGKADRMMRLLEQRDEARKTEEQLGRLCYRLARHLLNPDKIRLTTWARIGLEIMAELRDLDPAKYDEMVKPNTGTDSQEDKR